jgi:MFS family permease
VSTSAAQTLYQTGRSPLPIRSVVATVLLLAMTIFSGAAMRAVFSPVQEVARLDLGLSDFEISLVQGLAAAIPIALFAIPLGRLVDRTNRKRLLVAMAATWTVGSGLTVVAEGFALLFIARMLAGIGAVLSIPVAISIAADLTGPAHRGRALLLLSIGQMAGGAAAFAFGGWVFGFLETHAGLPFGLNAWRGMHLVFAAASAFLLIPLVLMREPARNELGEAADASLKIALAAMWRRRVFLIPLFVGQISVMMSDTAATIWASPVLMRDYGLQPPDFAGWMGAVVLISGIVGSLIGGFAADAGQKSRLKGGIILGAVVAALFSLPGTFFPLMPTVTGFAVLLTLLLLTGAVTGLITATTIAVVIPNEIRGICLGCYMVIGAIVGFGIAPTAVTVISGMLGGEAFIRYGLTATAFVTGIASLIGFLLAFRALRNEAVIPAAESV